MAKQRDWMDWVNTGANVLQTAQVSEIKGHLASLANAEAQREQRAKLHRLCRDFLIQMDAKIDELVESSCDSPKATHAAARMLQQKFEREEFTPSIFDDWADIDRAKATMSKLAKLLKETAAKCGPEWVKEVTDCLGYQATMADLEQLVALAHERDEQSAILDELNPLEAALPTLPVPASHETFKTLKAIALVVCFLSATVAIIAGGSGALETAEKGSATMLMAAALCVAMLSGAGIAAFSQSATKAMENSERGKALTRIGELKEELAKSGKQRVDEQKLLALAEKFGGDKPASELRGMFDDRTRRIDALFDSDQKSEGAASQSLFKD